MSDKLENPPAFPAAACDAYGRTHFQEGMTMRDYFAAKAMQSILNRMDICSNLTGGITYTARHGGVAYGFDEDKMAKIANDIADAMLKARTK